MTVSWLVLIAVAGLACFRLTRLVVTDDFPLVAVPRRWIIGDPYHTYDHEAGEWQPERRHEGRWFYWFGELISCPWCASGWVALAEIIGLALFTDRHAPLVDWGLTWIAVWAIGSTMAAKIG